MTGGLIAPENEIFSLNRFMKQRKESKTPLR